MSAPYRVTTGNAIADTIIAIVDAVVDRFIPAKHAELRPSRALLYFGLPLIAVGFGLAIWVQFAVPSADGTRLTSVVFGSIGAIGCFLCVLYFRFRVHFRSFGIHRYQWGRYIDTLPYASFRAAELGYWSALRLVRADGTYWNFPSSDFLRVLDQLLWNLNRGGVPVPDTIALRNRFGVASFETGSRADFRRDHPPRK